MSDFIKGPVDFLKTKGYTFFSGDDLKIEEAAYQIACKVPGCLVNRWKSGWVMIAFPQDA